MDRKLALKVLENELSKYRELNYSVLCELISIGFETYEIKKNNENYQISISALWDDSPNGNLRVCGAIDNGGLSSTFPKNSDFIIAPDGSFIDE